MIKTICNISFDHETQRATVLRVQPGADCHPISALFFVKYAAAILLEGLTKN